jgi:hypothetical protein
MATYDPETEAKLDEWVQAKRARDFKTSDAIQAELEAQGVDTYQARPDLRKAGANSGGASGGGGSNLWEAGFLDGRPTYDPETEAKLDQWVQAKRARDFKRSDAIEAELQAQGVDTQAARPDPKKAGANSWDASGGAGQNLWGAGAFGSASKSTMAHAGQSGYDPETEAMLDQWVQAKRALLSRSPSDSECFVEYLDVS